MTCDYKKEFDKLVNCKSLGFYNCAEKITIFLKNKADDSVTNYFTIFVFDERFAPDYKKSFLTKKLISISDSISVGIICDVISIEDAATYYETLCDNLENNTVDIGQGTLNKGPCEFVPKVFVPANSTKTPLINKVLKNNNINGSYIIEFFDVKKQPSTLINQAQLKKLNDTIYEIIPIDLFTISDRIGNFIFQFPSINLKHHYKADKEGNLNYSICVDKRLSGNINYQLMCESIFDDNIIGYGVEKILSAENNIKIWIGDTGNIINTSIIDVNSGIFLTYQSTSFIQNFHFSFSIGMRFGRQREIYDAQNNIIAALDIVSNEKLDGPQNSPDKYMSIIERRQYKKRTNDLLNNLEIKQYGKVNRDNQAIEDIIKIMNKASSGKVYLWDPYLCAEDILKTWYYTKIFGLCLHAITSSEIAKLQKVSLLEWREEQKEIFEKRSNNYGIRLEFRCQHDNFGYGFHDRFIMIINEKEKPKVWSIGTSINSLGNSHHIIQEVQHPQMIVDAFEELWDELSDETCLIWRKD